MRLFALVATALMIAGSASANVFDPSGSIITLRIAGLYGNPFVGDPAAGNRASLTGPAGSEQIVQGRGGMGNAHIWATSGFTNGAEFFTGTPNITNIFLTMQNGSGTFTQAHDPGNFQGSNLCGGSCFAGSAPLRGQTITEILGTINAVTPLSGVGDTNNFVSSKVGALGATIFVENAEWIADSVTITNIATNIISITTGPRSGQTGIGFTLQLSPFEDSIPTPSGENGVTSVVVAGTTDFTPATGGASPGVNQVTLIVPVHIDASTLTSNPPVPGLGVQTLRYVPEPGTMLLLGSAVAGLLVVGRKRMKR